MATEKLVDHYYYDEAAYDYHDGGYIPLVEPAVSQQPRRTRKPLTMSITRLLPRRGKLSYYPELKPKPGVITLVY